MSWNGMGKRAEPRAGAEATADIVVSQADLASQLNLGDDDCFPAVFATSRMIALMELAAARVLEPWLEPGELSVGVTVEITHTAATPCGTVVGAEAKYLGRDGKLFLFEVVACDEGGEIGRGFHKRAIVDTERLMTGALRRVAPEPRRESPARGSGRFAALLGAGLLVLGAAADATAQMTPPDRADFANPGGRSPGGHPGQLGLIGFADGGRVFRDGETSSTWHTGVGGGVWLSWLGPANTLSAVIGRSEEKTAIYLKFGMSY